MNARKRVLLTGASGSMGNAAFHELWSRRDAYDIVLLVRPSPVNKKTFAPYEGGKSTPARQKSIVEHDGLKIVWGDLTSYGDVLEAVTGVDFVLHPAAFISPAADHHPDMAEETNVGAAENLVRAIKAQPDGGDSIRLVNIASLAMYGDRLPPIHWVRCGDPLKPSVYDFYAVTKTRAERIVVESGLKWWASIRQTYIAIPDIFSLMDPILFHQPLNTCMEMVTSADAGYGLVQSLECPDDFYGRIYNMGGGPAARITFNAYVDKMMRMLGMGDFRRIMERDWFCLRNFHCNYFEDSGILNDYLGHWRQSVDDHCQQVLDQLPGYVRLGQLVPSPLIKQFLMKRMAADKNGPLGWRKHRNDGRISAFYGSYQRVEEIPGWNEPVPPTPENFDRLSHGYDDSKSDNALTLDDLRDAADFRGGACLSTSFEGMSHPLEWKCAFEHTWKASPTLVLRAGHWCPECLPPVWDYDRIAKKNPFFAQIYYPNHDRDENNTYDMHCFEDIV